MGSTEPHVKICISEITSLPDVAGVMATPADPDPDLSWEIYQIETTATQAHPNLSPADTVFKPRISTSLEVDLFDPMKTPVDPPSPRDSLCPIQVDPTDNKRTPIVSTLFDDSVPSRNSIVDDSPDAGATPADPPLFGQFLPGNTPIKPDPPEVLATLANPPLLGNFVPSNYPIKLLPPEAVTKSADPPLSSDSVTSTTPTKVDLIDSVPNNIPIKLNPIETMIPPANQKTNQLRQRFKDKVWMQTLEYIVSRLPYRC